MTDVATVEPIAPTLQLITGGRDRFGNDWLAALPPATIFLARPKKNPDGTDYKGFVLVSFEVGGWEGQGRIIVEDSQRVHTVDSKRFSDTMELFSVVAYGILHDEEGPKNEEAAGADNDDSNPPDT